MAHPITETVAETSRNGMTASLLRHSGGTNDFYTIGEAPGTVCWEATMQGPITVVDNSEVLQGFMREGECDRENGVATFTMGRTDEQEALEGYECLLRDLEEAFP